MIEEEKTKKVDTELAIVLAGMAFITFVLICGGPEIVSFIKALFWR